MNNNRLDPKYIFAIALALSFLVLGLWYTFRYQARQEEMTNLKTEIETATAQVEQYRQAEAQLPALREEVAQLETERAAFVAALPQKTEMASLLGEMRTNAQKSGTNIQGVNAEGDNSTADLPGGVRPIPIAITMVGNYDQVFRTLQAMETMNRFSTIDQLVLQSGEATTLNPDLNGTLNMTVYTFDPALAAPVATTEGGASAAPAASADATTPAPAEGTTPAPEGASQ